MCDLDGEDEFLPSTDSEADLGVISENELEQQWQNYLARMNGGKADKEKECSSSSEDEPPPRFLTSQPSNAPSIESPLYCVSRFHENLTPQRTNTSGTHYSDRNRFEDSSSSNHEDNELDFPGYVGRSSKFNSGTSYPKSLLGEDAYDKKNTGVKNMLEPRPIPGMEELAMELVPIPKEQDFFNRIRNMRMRSSPRKRRRSPVVRENSDDSCQEEPSTSSSKSKRGRGALKEFKMRADIEMEEKKELKKKVNSQLFDYSEVSLTDSYSNALDTKSTMNFSKNPSTSEVEHRPELPPSTTPEEEEEPKKSRRVETKFKRRADLEKELMEREPKKQYERDSKQSTKLSDIFRQLDDYNKRSRRESYSNPLTSKSSWNKESKESECDPLSPAAEDMEHKLCKFREGSINEVKDAELSDSSQEKKKKRNKKKSRRRSSRNRSRDKNSKKSKRFSEYKKSRKKYKKAKRRSRSSSSSENDTETVDMCYMKKVRFDSNSKRFEESENERKSCTSSWNDSGYMSSYNAFNGSPSQPQKDSLALALEGLGELAMSILAAARRV